MRNRPTMPPSSRPLRRRDVLAALAGLGIGAALPGCSTQAASSSEAPWQPGPGGVVVRRGDASYERWRRGMPWQGWVAARSPDCIVRPANRRQIADALAYARQSGMKVVVKSGGHNVSEAFLRDRGMLLDLAEFRTCRVERETASAWVEPSLWSRNLMLDLAPAGFAFPVAHCATVPMGGYLLGGGIGINTDQWGIGCHSVTAAEVVLADGSTVIASADENPDLFWALRGAGTGFFGVVTAYRIRCQPLPRDIRESIYAFPLARAPEVAQWLEEVAVAGTPHTELMMLLAHNPRAAPGSDPADHKVCIARVVQFCDSETQCRELLAPVSRHPMAAEAAMRLELQPTSIEKMMIGSVDAAAGLGFGRSAVNTIWTARTSDAVAAVSEPLARAPSPKTHFVISLRHNRTVSENACFSAIDRGFVGCYAVWDEPAEDSANFAWTEDVTERMQPFASGSYINEMDGFRDPARIANAFSPAARERLAALRRRYDPQGLFHDFPGLS